MEIVDPTDIGPDYDPGEPRPEAPRCAICGAVAMKYRHGAQNLHAFMCLEDSCGARVVFVRGQLRRLRPSPEGYIIDTSPAGVVKHPGCR